MSNKIYILSKSFIIYEIIDIKDYQRVVHEGRYTIKLKFYNSKSDIQIRHFSNSNLTSYVKNFLMLNNPNEGYHYIKHTVAKILNTHDAKRVLNFMVNSTKKLLSKSSYYYHQEVYDLINFNIKEHILNITNLSKKLSRKLFFSTFFMFSQLKSLHNIYKSIYPFRNKLYFSKKKVMSMDENNPIRVLFEQNESRFERPRSKVADILDSLEEYNNSITKDEKDIGIIKNKVKHLTLKKHAPIIKTSRISTIIYDPQYIEIFNYSYNDSEKIENIAKSRKDSVNFNKVVFNITIPKSFGKKEHKTLELNNNGNFIIAERDKVRFRNV